MVNGADVGLKPTHIKEAASRISVVLVLSSRLKLDPLLFLIVLIKSGAGDNSLYPAVFKFN
jgi:hypothetical protein